MAKMIFRDDKICHLEEYAQTMTGPGVKWPGLGEEVSDADIQARIRQDPLILPKKKDILCDRCGVAFPSRTQLFRHLKSMKAAKVENGVEIGCIPVDADDTDDDTSCNFVWVCLSVGYSYSKDIKDAIRQALLNLVDGPENTKQV